MALVVEDGTGLPNAESYLSVAEFRAYCARENVDLGAVTDTDIEGWARQAARYIDSEWLYKAVIAFPNQAMEFPRSGLQWSGREVVGIPRRLKDAQAGLMLAIRTSGPLRSIMAHGGRIKSEAVGPISVTYMDGAPAGNVYDESAALLAPYVRTTANTNRPAPRYTAPDAAPAFALGMQGGSRFGGALDE
jgi:hypothetical protein